MCKKKKNPQYGNNKIDWSKISSLSFPCYALSSITNTSSATAAPHSGDCQCCMPFLFHLLTVSLVATPRDLNLDCVMSRVRTCLFPSTALDNCVFPKYIYIFTICTIQCMADQQSFTDRVISPPVDLTHFQQHQKVLGVLIWTKREKKYHLWKNSHPQRGQSLSRLKCFLDLALL